MIRHIDMIDSTSRYLMDHPDWFENLDVISASHQTAGIGRSGHTWLDNKDENILCSIMIKDEKLIDSYKLLSVSLGVIILNFLKGYISEDHISLKWPNDVYINGKKVCGILLQGKLPEYVVVGIGININQTDFKELNNATSLAVELGESFNLENIRSAFCKYIVEQLKSFDTLKQSFVEEFNNHNYLFRKEITYFDVTTNTEQEAVALNINESGELLISKGESIIQLSASEVNKIH